MKGAALHIFFFLFSFCISKKIVQSYFKILYRKIRIFFINVFIHSLRFFHFKKIKKLKKSVQLWWIKTPGVNKNVLLSSTGEPTDQNAS